MKKMRRLVTVLLAGVMLFSTITVYATDASALPVDGSAEAGTEANTEGTSAENGDVVVIEENDKPYLSLGADLSAEQQHTVLSLMGIDASQLDEYDVVYVNNNEEHEYLGAYVPSEKIGTHALSSVVIVKTEEGTGIDIATYNINYCTVGMYKNALATAGITDAKIIVAGPFPISGTAALLGAMKAYTQMTGEELDESIVDAAMDELVTTGNIEEGMTTEEAESFERMVAELKSAIANGTLSTEEEIREAVEAKATEYGIELSEEDIAAIIALLQKLKDLDLDWDVIEAQANEFANAVTDLIVQNAPGIGAAIKEFFQQFIDWLMSLF